MIRIQHIRFTAFLLAACISNLQATIHAVFVHGTFVPGVCAVTNPIDVYTQQCAPSNTYTRTLKKLRADDTFFHASIMGHEGFHPITTDADLSISCQRYAAHQIAHIFTILDPETPQKFYTFGWSGELSLAARRAAAADLYQALKNIPLQKGDTLELICHSHGGNVAAYLAEEEKIQKQGLSIERLVLLGTPIQYETQHLFTEPLFKNVWALWSKKDIIVVSDTFSTPSRTSARSLLDRLQGPTSNRIHDVDIRLEGRSYFGHRALFYFGVHLLPYFEVLYRPHHRTLQHFRLLPLVTLVPVLRTMMPAFDDQNSLVTLNIKSDNKRWFFELNSSTRSLTSHSYVDELQQIHDRLEREWLPVGYTKELFSNTYAGWCGLSARVQDWTCSACQSIAELWDSKK